MFAPLANLVIIFFLKKMYSLIKQKIEWFFLKSQFEFCRNKYCESVKKALSA